jgi:WD40 repeat protein
VHILQLDDAACTPLNILTHHQPITCVRYSDNGRYLVAADSGRRIVPYDVQVCARTLRRTHTHTCRTITLWHRRKNGPFTRRKLRALLGRLIIVDWQRVHSTQMYACGTCRIRANTRSSLKVCARAHAHTCCAGAHPMSHVTALAWMTPTRLISCGHDSNVKLWAIDEPATP